MNQGQTRYLVDRGRTLMSVTAESPIHAPRVLTIRNNFGTQYLSMHVMESCRAEITEGYEFLEEDTEIILDSTGELIVQLQFYVNAGYLENMLVRETPRIRLPLLMGDLRTRTGLRELENRLKGVNAPFC